MSAFFYACRVHFGYALLFSMCSNLLLLAVPLYMLQIFDRVLTSRSHETLALLTLVTVGAIALNTWLDRLRAHLLSAASLLLDQTLAPAVLARALEPADPSAPPASLRDVATLRSLLSSSSLISVFDAPWTPLYLGIIFMFHTRLGVIATVGALLMLTLAWLNERFTVGPLERARAAGQHAAACADAGIRQRETIQAHGMRAALMRHWSGFSETASNAAQLAEHRTGVFLALTRFTRLGLQVALLAAGALLVIDQQVSTGVMLTGTLILARALAPIENALSSWRQFVDAHAAFQRLDKALQPLAVHPATGTSLLGAWAPSGGALVADRVVVAHQGTALLKSVSFTLAAGESLGIVGPSGAGKTLLARTLAGVVVPGSGSVRLDGADMRTLVSESDGRCLGYLTQDARLFPGTIAQNIARLGDIDEARVLDAARLAHAHDMILRLPRGYQTPVGDGAMPLSAGQIQRVALARALYGPPGLLVLDEPDAHLDGEAMEHLLLTLRRLRERGVSVVLLTHRPTLVAQMDKLLMLRDGQAVQYGLRAEVLARLGPGTASPRSQPMEASPAVSPAMLQSVDKERMA